MAEVTTRDPLTDWTACRCPLADRRATPCLAGCRAPVWWGIHWRTGHWHLECAFARVLSELTTLRRELDQERQIAPTPGVWLVEVKPGRRRERCISYLGDVPEPIALAAVAQHEDALAAAIRECWELYRDKGSQAPLDVAHALVEALHAAGAGR